MNTKLIYATIGIAVTLGMIGTSFLNFPTASAGSDKTCANYNERQDKLALRNEEGEGENENNDHGIDQALIHSDDNSACD